MAASSSSSSSMAVDSAPSTTTTTRPTSRKRTAETDAGSDEDIIDPTELQDRITAEQHTMEDTTAIPSFKSLTPQQLRDASDDKVYLRINVPPHRYTPLKNNWLQIYQPIVTHMKLQIRFNIKRKCIELRTTNDTTQQAALTKSADFVRAFMFGFEVRDAIALLRLDDLYLDSFEVKDVKTLEGDHLSRAIGRVAGVGGKTKFTIENATRTRIVLADSHIHILGSYSNIQFAKNALVRLIMGSPPSKIYGSMRNLATRQKAAAF